MTDEIDRLRAENELLLKDIAIRDHMILWLQDELMKYDLVESELLTDEEKRQWYDSLSPARIQHLKDSLRDQRRLFKT
jgi:hypothetical protein